MTSPAANQASLGLQRDLLAAFRDLVQQDGAGEAGGFLTRITGADRDRVVAVRDELVAEKARLDAALALLP